MKLGLVTDTGLSMDGLLFGDGDAIQRELAGKDGSTLYIIQI